ncbi:hypothetical protein ACHAXN_012057 [Cyclotella atomus]
MASYYVHDRYLYSEERYEIFTVKAAERPHLLHWKPGQKDDDEPVHHAEEKKTECCSDDDDVCNEVPPLTDGCDLPGWRCKGISPCMNNATKNHSIDVDHPFQGTLNIGAGSTLFRRERMFPFICSNTSDAIESCWWYSAKQMFNIAPPSDRAAPVVQHEDVAALVDYDANRNEKRKVTIFSLEYEEKNYPVKIMNATKGWSAMPDYDTIETDTTKDRVSTKGWADTSETSTNFSANGKGGWTFANLKSRFGDVMFRFSDQHGEMLSLNTYSKYITNPEGLSDDSPLGIYDSEFGDDDITKVLLDEYEVPKCFSPDVFDLADDGSSDQDEEVNNTRPPYRWILIGPERSGTGMHVDPLWTNAFVTVLQGLKRWLLFPPDTPHEMIGMYNDKPQIPSSIWFRDYYDKVTSSSWPKCFSPVDVLQYPGETVFVPAGWPHIVLNLELTVAVTHNYASEFGPFDQMMKEVLRDEPEFAKRWIKGLKKHGRQDLIRGVVQSI